MDQLPLSEEEQEAAATRSTKMKKHAKKHKKKYLTAGTVATLVAVLELWQQLCPLLPWNIQCEKQKPLAEFGISKLQELQDAGF